MINIRHFLHVPGEEQWMMHTIYDDGEAFKAMRFYPTETLVGEKGMRVEVINLPSGRYTVDNKIIVKWEE